MQVSFKIVYVISELMLTRDKVVLVSGRLREVLPLP